MFRKLLERLRGSSRAPDDLAVGTTRPGDFADEPEVVRERGEGPVEPNPHEEEDERRP
jgi:hypothetical protein